MIPHPITSEAKDRIFKLLQPVPNKTYDCPWDCDPHYCERVCKQVFHKLANCYSDFCTVDVLTDGIRAHKPLILKWFVTVFDQGYIESIPAFLPVNYTKYGSMMKGLVDQIKLHLLDDLDYVYGIPRGGLPIAVHVSHHTGLDLITREEDPIWNSKMRILVVDDISDTGATLTKLMERMPPSGPSIKTACLFIKPHTEFVPDLYVSSTEDWVIYPWEKT